MKSFIATLSAFFMFIAATLAQDIVTRKNGDFLRGIIKASDAYTVVIQADGGEPRMLKVKDVKDFFWNGDTYISKTFFDSKKPEERFAKVIETGAINLYAIGGSSAVGTPKRSPARARPSIGVGMGTGGMGGMGGGLGGGIGGTISFGGGRNVEDEALQQPAKTWYYIEKPGKNGVQSVPFAIVTPDQYKRAVRDILLLNLGDDPAIAAQLNSSAAFDRKDVIEYIRAYNAKHSSPVPASN